MKHMTLLNKLKEASLKLELYIDCVKIKRTVSKRCCRYFFAYKHNCSLLINRSKIGLYDA